MRSSAIQLTSVGLARTCPNKEIDNIVLVRLWVCACVCVCVFMGGVYYIPFTTHIFLTFPQSKQHCLACPACVHSPEDWEGRPGPLRDKELSLQ